MAQVALALPFHHFQKPFQLAHWPHLMYLVTYLDSLALDCSSPKFRDPRFTLESSLPGHRDLLKISTASLSVCPSPLGSLGLRYHVKTRERRGSSFSQLGLEPNHTGLTAQSLFFLEELCRVKRSDTQTFSNYSKRFIWVSTVCQAHKNLQTPTNSYQITYQASSSHQVPKTWVKQHPKTPQPTKTNENPSPSYLHAQIGSYLVYIHSSDCYYQLYKVYLLCSHAHALFPR